MIRSTLLWLFVAYFCAISWKDWYKGVCGLILLMAFIERPDVPKQLLDIPGLNPWNILFVNLLVASMVTSGRDKLRVATPAHIKIFAIYYVVFILVAFFREVGDLSGMVQFAQMLEREPLTTQGIIQEDIFNTIKYAVPGILLFYGCNSKERFKLATWTLFALNVCLAIQIIKVMPLGEFASGHLLDQAAIRRIDRYIGYFRSDLAILLGGAAWAMFCTKELVTTASARMAIYGASFLTIVAVALTGSRIGIGACMAVGTVMAWYRWRKIFLLAPLAALIIIFMAPSVSQRFTQGFSNNPDDRYEQTNNEGGPDFNSITSGRTIIWPRVIDKIQEHPFFGYGRRAMQRIGLSMQLGVEYHEPFPHPHNAYLELFLDNGFVLGIPILIFYLIMLKYAIQMFRVKNNALCQTAGGIALAFIVTFLVGAIGQQSFYPARSFVSIGCAIGLLLRIFIEYPPAGFENNSNEQERLSWVQLENEPLPTRQP